MRLLKRFSGLFNFGLRASTLAFRFLLSFYIIKYIGLEATGIYGLAVGAVGIVPALIGWGLNNLLSREIVGGGAVAAGPRIKTRLLVTGVSLVAFTVIVLAGALWQGVALSSLYLLILLLVWFETLALDLHMPLIGLEKAVEANLLVFIRSALWVPVAMGLGVVFPALRNLEMVFWMWIASHVLALVMLWYFSRRLHIRGILSAPIEWGWLKDKLRKGRAIYVSDLGIVGLIYADRYVVGLILGLTLTGIYSFYWSLANALQTLVATAVVQTALPILVRSYREGSRDGWYRVMKREMIKTALLTPALAIGIMIGSEVLIYMMGMSNLSEHRLLFSLMLAAAVIRCCSDLLNVGLISAQADKLYVYYNIAGVFISLGLMALGSYLWGLDGAGIASLITAVLLLAMRVYGLRYWIRKDKLLS